MNQGDWWFHLTTRWDPLPVSKSLSGHEQHQVMHCNGGDIKEENLARVIKGGTGIRVERRIINVANENYILTLVVLLVLFDEILINAAAKTQQSKLMNLK